MLLKLDAITRSFDLSTANDSIEVLSDVSLEVEKGDTVSITGPSGSGKSTLLNIIGTLDRPSTGTVRFFGQDMSGIPDKQLAEIRNKDIGFIFQQHHLLPQCTVLENVLIPVIPRRKKSDSALDQERAVSLLRKVGLDSHLNCFPAKLSGGERQRAAVVRALINRPQLILADEPTGSLDQAASENLGQLLLDLNEQEGTALIVVTHSLELAARMERMYKLIDGRLEIQKTGP